MKGLLFSKTGFLEGWTMSIYLQEPLANYLVVKLAKTNTVHIALRLGSRVEALTTAQQQ